MDKNEKKKWQREDEAPELVNEVPEWEEVMTAIEDMRELVPGEVRQR